jgi:polyhydroxyalkanoate synthesis regulator protein
VMENMASMPNPMSGVPGFEAMRKQQEAFLKSMMGGMATWGAAAAPAKAEPETKPDADELAAIKRQLAELQTKLSKL